MITLFKRKWIMIFAVCSVGLTACNNEVKASKEAEKQIVETLPMTDCKVEISGVHFTKALNGAENMLTLNDDGSLDFRSEGKKDFFNDPNGNKVSSSPVLLTQIDNTKPFTFQAKIQPNFVETGTYDAGTLYVYSDKNFWQKFAFEQDERGKHRVVTVRTIGTSDDNNHDVVEQPYVYFKISSDTQTIGFYYSLDKITWQMARLYRNEYPQELWLGISAQCPMGEGSVSQFSEVQLSQESIKNFRLGE